MCLWLELATPIMLAQPNLQTPSAHIVTTLRLLRVLRVIPGPQKAMYQRKMAQLHEEGKLNNIDIYTMFV